MRRLVALSILPLITLAACGGSDSDDTDRSTTATTGAVPADSTTDSSVTSTAPAELTLFDIERCETEPDPADYGDPPIAVRPCEAPTELGSQTVVEGSGPAAAAGDTVVVDYTGIRSVSGEMFDSSFNRGQPFFVTLGSGSVIQGWDEGLIGIQAGEVRRLDIPAELAYGSNPPSAPIEADDPLTFVIVAHAVIPPVNASDAPVDTEIETPSDAAKTTVEVVTEGDGAAVAAGSNVLANIVLFNGDDGSVLLSSWDQGQPVQIVLQDQATLPGLITGLTDSTVGDRLIIVMPPADAFGDAGEPNLGLPADTDLIAVVDVIATF